MASYLLQEDGTKLTLEDGTGFLLLEEEAVGGGTLQWKRVLGLMEDHADDYYAAWFG